MTPQNAIALPLLAAAAFALAFAARTASGGQAKMLAPEPGRTSEWHEVTPESPAPNQEAPPIPVEHHSPWDRLPSDVSIGPKPHAPAMPQPRTPGANRPVAAMPAGAAKGGESSHVYEAIGPENAPVTIVEYVDYIDPFLGAVRDKLAYIKAKDPDQVRIVIIDFPWRRSPIEINAAVAARCAGEQNEFWRYYVALCDGPALFDENHLDAIARHLDVDLTAFDECLKSGRHRDEVMEELAEGEFAGVKRTPTVFVNGTPVRWDNLDALNDAVDRALATDRADR